MLLREIIVPDNQVVTMHLPSEMVGKTIEVIAFEIQEGTGQKNTSTKDQRLQKIDKLTLPTLVDLSNFKFDRNEANNYEQ